MSANSNKSGFTLVELLIVIVIIMILAALLLPAFRKAREKGRQSNCMNNLHQVSLGITLYQDDHKEELPPFLSRLFPDYIVYGRSKVLLCKSDVSKGKDGSKPNNAPPSLGDQYPETDDVSGNANTNRNPAITVCSYMYECSAAQCSWGWQAYLGADIAAVDRNGDNVASWGEVKLYQLKNGDTTNGNEPYSSTTFPMVRCFHHHAENTFTVDNPDPPPATLEQGLTLNVAYAGNVFRGPLHWELFGGASQ